MTCWLVASEGSLDRWVPAFEEADVDVHPLIVSHLAPPDDAAQITRALRAREHDLVVITSANALAFVDPREAQGWVAAAVGARTAHAARAAGFDLEFVGGAGAEALARGLIDEAPALDGVLFLRGERARDEGPAVMRDAGIRVDEVVTYRMAREPAFAEALAAAPDPDTIVAGSPDAVDAVLDLRDVGAGVRWVTLGETTRAHLRSRGIEHIACSASPRVEDLVETVIEGVE